MPSNPDDPWGPIGGTAMRLLADAHHAIERVLHLAFGDYQPTVYLPAPDRPQPGNTATLLAVVAIVLASAALGTAIGTRRRVAGPLEPTDRERTQRLVRSLEHIRPAYAFCVAPPGAVALIACRTHRERTRQ